MALNITATTPVARASSMSCVILCLSFYQIYLRAKSLNVTLRYGRSASQGSGMISGKNMQDDGRETTTNKRRV